MSTIKLGQIEYVNCLPVYHAIRKGVVPIDADMVKGPPSKLNKMFINGELDITPISSIEFARNSDKAVILPKMCISSDGYVESLLLFSKVPVTELDGMKVSLTSSSATTVALLKILFEHYYQIKVEYITQKPDLDKMLEDADAALLIGDDALVAGAKEANGSLHITDLGQAWKDFTGLKMVYALWVIHKNFVNEHPEEVDKVANAFIEAKEYGFNHVSDMVDEAEKETKLSRASLQNYFEKTIQYEFGEEEQKALLTFYDYAYKSGLIDERVKLNIWGEDD